MENFKVYNLKELTQILGISYRAVADYVRLGRIKAVKIGKEWKVSEKNLMAFLNGETTGNPANGK